MLLFAYFYLCSSAFVTVFTELHSLRHLDTEQ